MFKSLRFRLPAFFLAGVALAGVVSTAREPGERPAVVTLVDSKARLYPVGRLDADSTGLLLLKA